MHVEWSDLGSPEKTILEVIEIQTGEYWVKMILLDLMMSI